jgi:hypothetical protein
MLFDSNQQYVEQLCLSVFNYFQLCWDENMKACFEVCFDVVLWVLKWQIWIDIYIYIFQLSFIVYWIWDINWVIYDCENDLLKNLYFMRILCVKSMIMKFKYIMFEHHEAWEWMWEKWIRHYKNRGSL